MSKTSFFPSEPVLQWCGLDALVVGKTNTYAVECADDKRFVVHALVQPAQGGYVHECHIECVMSSPGATRRGGVAFVSRIDEATYRIESGSYGKTMPRTGVQLNRFPTALSEKLAPRADYVSRGKRLPHPKDQ